MECGPEDGQDARRETWLAGNSFPLLVLSMLLDEELWLVLAYIYTSRSGVHCLLKSAMRVLRG